MSAGIAVAVDGGNSKTDLALVQANGELLSLVRGPVSSPHHIGLDGCIELLGSLLADAAGEAGLDPAALPVAAVGHFLLAGADLPEEERALSEAVNAQGWAERASVDNDTFALLRAGTERGWGVAVVCGAGINCVGVSPDGHHARFPSLGPITGDWGGGNDVGTAALYAAARSADGRGPLTSLEAAVPAHFGLADPLEVAEAIHFQRFSSERLGELARVVFAESSHDEVAGEIVDRLANEVLAFVRVVVERLGLAAEQPDVVLGGGLLRSPPERLIARVTAGVAEVAPRAAVRVEPSPPIVGAALLGLDELGAGGEAQQRVRREIRGAAAALENGAAGVRRPATVEPGGLIDG